MCEFRTFKNCIFVSYSRAKIKWLHMPKNMQFPTLTTKLKQTSACVPSRSHSHPPNRLAEMVPTTLLAVSPKEMQKLRIR